MARSISNELSFEAIYFINDYYNLVRTVTDSTGGIEYGAFNMNLAANYVSSMRTRAGQGPLDPQETIESHVVWDMTAAWRFTSNLSTYVKVDNLFDETYIAARRPSGARPGLPRTAYLGLTYRL